MRFILFILYLKLFFFTNSLYPVSNPSRYIKGKQYSLEDLNYSLNIPTLVQKGTVTLSQKILSKRLHLSKKIPEVEPIYLFVKKNKSNIKNWIKFVGQPKHLSKIEKIILRKIKANKYSSMGDHLKIIIDLKLIKYLDKKKLANQFKKKHNQIFIENRFLKYNKKHLKAFLRQISPYHSQGHLKKIKSKIFQNDYLDFSRYILPTFAKKNLKKFTPFKGPNCFHAALSFHSEDYGKSKKFNIKKERNHHNMMINYDELYRILYLDFRELNPKKHDLKFGDIIVFFDKEPATRRDELYFKWMKHTLVYLFNDFTFSKGSKSANTPYTIKTLKQEWNTWKRLTRNMKLKVFRRKPAKVIQNNSNNSSSWLN